MVSPVTHRRGAPQFRARAARTAVGTHATRHTRQADTRAESRDAYHTALDGDPYLERSFLRRFRLSKKRRPGRSRLARIGDRPGPLRPRARINRRPSRGPVVRPFGVRIGRARTHIMRGRCARCATSVYGSEASGCRARATSSATASTSSSSTRPSRQTHALLPASAGGTQRCPRDLDALAYRQPLAVATFRWSPVSSFGYLCREERGAPWPPGRVLLTGAATERHRHAQDVLGWRAACSGEPV